MDSSRDDTVQMPSFEDFTDDEDIIEGSDDEEVIAPSFNDKSSLKTSFKPLGLAKTTISEMDVSMKSVGTPQRPGTTMDVSMITPRQVRPVIESDDEDEEVIELSSDDEVTEPSFSSVALTSTPHKPTDFKVPLPAPPSLQPTKKPQSSSHPVAPVQPATATEPQSSVIYVDSITYHKQETKVRSLAMQMIQAKRTIESINIANLPDKGKLLFEKDKALGELHRKEMATLSKMVVSKARNTEVDEAQLTKLKIQESWKKATANTNHLQSVLMKPSSSTTQPAGSTIRPAIPQPHVAPNWNDLKQGFGEVQPTHFGKVGLATFQKNKALAVGRLEEMHGAIKTCPTEKDLADNPKELRVDLMEHQKRALAWLAWRETQKPRGGILADDMGLGKTLTMISLVLKQMSKDGVEDEEEDEESDDEETSVEKKKRLAKIKYDGGTLVVCPASLINQWEKETKDRVKRGALSVELYHGAKRETSARTLSQYDIVVTTYQIISNEYVSRGPPFKIRWNRIILDEGHVIRNHKTKICEGACGLSGRNKWVLTGTPVHNKELDMYALLKFLRCSPFDDLRIWKQWVGDKSSGGQERLHTVISSMMLRRTKTELMEKGEEAFTLPPKTFEMVEISMDKAEQDVYQKVLLFSRTLFAQFLHQRAEKRQETFDVATFNAPKDPNCEYTKMRQVLLKRNKVREIGQHEILVLLLRLRQICVHPSLITQMLNGDEDLGTDDDDFDRENTDLLEQLSKLDLDDNANDENSAVVGNGASEFAEDKPVSIKEAVRGYLNKSNPVFDGTRRSSKLRKVIEVLKKLDKSDKIVIVSQWRSLLEILAGMLKEEGIKYTQLDGKIPVHKRQPIVNSINNPNDPTRVLLLSLTAGGVGLNLMGANVLFMLDLHWNPQLENQAQDRVYRMGQKKPVQVYKFLVKDSIEERIQALQDKKLQLAQAVLTGSKQVIRSKLTLDDLKMLFSLAPPPSTSGV